MEVKEIIGTLEDIKLKLSELEKSLDGIPSQGSPALSFRDKEGFYLLLLSCIRRRISEHHVQGSRSVVTFSNTLDRVIEASVNEAIGKFLQGG